MGFIRDFITTYRYFRSLSTASTPRTGGSLDVFGGLGRGDMSIATVYRCVQILSDSVAKLRFQPRRLRDGVMQPDTTVPESYLLAVSPNSQMNAFTFWRYIVQDLLLSGNAYVLPQYSGASPRLEALWRIIPTAVQPDVERGIYNIGDAQRPIATVDASGIIHVVGMPSRATPGVGVSVLRHARETIEIQRSGDRETRKRFARGGNQQVVISNDTSVKGFGKHQTEALDKVASKMDSFVDENRRFITLPGDLKLNNVSMSSSDMQFLESRKFGVLEICRFFGVPPSFVFADTSSNYKSSEMAFTSFRSETLDPLLTNIECEFRRKLLPAELHGVRDFTFDRAGLFAADMMSQIDYATKAVGIGVKTPNEARASFNMPPVRGGDEPLFSANFKTLAALRNEELKTTAQNGK